MTDLCIRRHAWMWVEDYSFTNADLNKLCTIILRFTSYLVPSGVCRGSTDRRWSMNVETHRVATILAMCHDDANSRRPSTPLTSKNRMNCFSRVLFVTLAVFSLAVGCRASHELETAEVTGRVTIDGRPLTHGSVTFTPEQGRSATGVIQPDGSFVLQTYGRNGAIVGVHKVSVSCTEKLPDPPQDPKNADAGMWPQERSLIPERYTQSATSGMTFEVKSGEENDALLQLTSKP